MYRSALKVKVLALAPPPSVRVRGTLKTSTPSLRRLPCHICLVKWNKDNVGGSIQIGTSSATVQVHSRSSKLALFGWMPIISDYSSCVIHGDVAWAYLVPVPFERFRDNRRHNVPTENSFYPRDALQSAVFAVVRCPSVHPSVCPSVCHTLVLCLNG